MMLGDFRRLWCAAVAAVSLAVSAARVQAASSLVSPPGRPLEKPMLAEASTTRKARRLVSCS